MDLLIYKIDAFSKHVFGGNPAAVVIMHWKMEDSLMQNIAAECNLSETAFLYFEEDHISIRWFTPTKEVDLCGHATLASAHMMFTSGLSPEPEIRFESKSGTLYARKVGSRIQLDFPARPPHPWPVPEGLTEAPGAEPESVHMAERDLLVVYPSEADVANLQPDFDKVAQLEAKGVIVTARGRDVDFVSRYFAPQLGVDEDPVTGSAHCTLTPYWAKRLNNPDLEAQQISARGGQLWCEDRGDRVLIAGHAVTFSMGRFWVRSRKK